ncbi:hypothetical protein ABT297_21060 [Dactylosporangium sp. NPDC000555]|uniref:hypothetical protein n=1 Tax=Dactylosporangium sp. NPDC000555 TaxID=3154260 RepID=UPI003326978B
MSILAGGITPASATAVCAGTAVPAADVPELLAGLVDRSLFQLAPDPGRYRMLETLREYGTDRLAETGDLGTVRDLAAGYFAELIARHDPPLRGPGQLPALRVVSAEYDNALAALRRRCDTGDGPGAVALALNLTWYWQMFGRRSDAAYWLGEAVAVPGGEATPDRDCARAIHLLSFGAGMTAELTDRLLADPELTGRYGALIALLPAEPVLERLAGGGDVWLSGLAHLLRAERAENAGELDQVRTDVAAALACFRRAGDRWGQATVLPLRAQLRQYDGDLDGALADLRAARSLAGEFGALGRSDEVFIDLRWFDLYLRRGDTDLAIAVIGSARERALRANSPETLALIDAWEAGFRVRLGDLDRARELLDDAERTLPGDTTFPGDHARTLLGNMRAVLCLELGDQAGAGAALAKAYAAAVAARDLPILSLVAVTSAAFVSAQRRQHESAVLLGAAARLRGAHDRTDRRFRELTRRGRAALGEEAFAEAYGKGWELDGKTAVTQVDPARPAARWPATAAAAKSETGAVRSPNEAAVGAVGADVHDRRVDHTR